MSLASRSNITPSKIVPTKVQTQTPTKVENVIATRNQSPTRIVQTLQKGTNLIEAERYISSLNQGRASPERVNQIKPTSAGPSPVVKIERLLENQGESQGKIQGNVQTQLIQGQVGAGHQIGNTLKRYGQGGAIISH